MTARGFYVVGVYGDSASLLTPTGAEAGDGLSLKEAKRAIWWQHEPRGESSTPWYICRPDPEAPGVMIGHRAELLRPNAGPGGVHRVTGGGNVRLNIAVSEDSPMTFKAHAETLAAIWPQSVEFAERVLTEAGNDLTRAEAALEAAETRGDAEGVRIHRASIEAADKRESAAHEAYRRALGYADNAAKGGDA